MGSWDLRKKRRVWHAISGTRKRVTLTSSPVLDRREVLVSVAATLHYIEPVVHVEPPRFCSIGRSRASAAQAGMNRTLDAWGSH